MPTSTYPLWVADQKYARAAQFLGLKLEPKNADESVREQHIDALRRAVFDLAREAGQPLSIAELGISIEDYQAKLPELVADTFQDMSMRTNPALPLVEDLQQLLIDAYPPKERP
jgi:alcohol dehydrogenase class IV